MQIFQINILDKIDCFPIDISAVVGFLMFDSEDEEAGVSNSVRTGAGAGTFRRETLDTVEATWFFPESKMRSRVSPGCKDRVVLPGTSAIMMDPEVRESRTDEMSQQKYMHDWGDASSFMSRVIRVSDFILERMPMSTASTVMTVIVPYRR